MEMSRQDGYELGIEQGEASGLERGIAQGEASGRAERELEMARAMRAEGIDTETITRVSGLPKEKIQML